MEYIELKWVNENGNKFILSDEINTRIEINETNKEIKNAKAFFREIIYLSFLNNWHKKIVLLDDPDNEIPEVKSVINELIELCNNELGARNLIT